MLSKKWIVLVINGVSYNNREKNLFFYIVTNFFGSHGVPWGSQLLFLHYRGIILDWPFSFSRKLLHHSEPYWRFFSFFLQKVWYLLRSFFESFLLVFDNILLTFLYIENKVVKNKTFYQEFALKITLIYESFLKFSTWESEEISMSSIIYFKIFLYLTKYWHCYKNTWEW